MAGLCAYMALVTALASIVAADYGSCTYNTERCACKYGSATQGRCWDPVTSTPGMCVSRWCTAGWTCACSGRTHLCYLSNHSPIAIADADKSKASAACPIDPATGAPGRAEGVTKAAQTEISLGTFKFEISPAGVAANEYDCLQLFYSLMRTCTQRARDGN